MTAVQLLFIFKKKFKNTALKKTFCLSFKRLFCCCCCFLNYYLNFFLFFVSRIMSCRQSAAYQVALFIPVIPNLRAVAQNCTASTTKRAAKTTAKVINWRLNWKLIWKLHKTTIVFLCIFFKCSDLDQKESLCTGLRGDYVQTTPYLRASCWGFNYNPRTHSCKGFLAKDSCESAPGGRSTRGKGADLSRLSHVAVPEPGSQSQTAADRRLQLLEDKCLLCKLSVAQLLSLRSPNNTTDCGRTAKAPRKRKSISSKRR